MARAPHAYAAYRRTVHWRGWGARASPRWRRFASDALRQLTPRASGLMRRSSPGRLSSLSYFPARIIRDAKPSLTAAATICFCRGRSMALAINAARRSRRARYEFTWSAFYARTPRRLASLIVFLRAWPSAHGRYFGADRGRRFLAVAGQGGDNAFYATQDCHFGLPRTLIFISHLR